MIGSQREGALAAFRALANRGSVRAGWTATAIAAPGDFDRWLARTLAEVWRRIECVVWLGAVAVVVVH